MRVSKSFVIGALLIASATSFAQQGKGNQCTPDGVWYGGSKVAYRFTIIPAGPAGHYVTFAEGMYKNSVMTTMFAGELAKAGDKYEGTLMALNTQDPAYAGPPPYAALPNIAVGWASIEMLDCNTMMNTIPFYGMYFGAPSQAGPGIWEPGTPWTGISWVEDGKVPFVDPPDVDLIVMATGDTKPIVETYHRVLRTVNPDLLHH
jgi:hypothetical protein